MKRRKVITGSMLAVSLAMVTAVGLALGSGCCGAGSCPLRGRKADKGKAMNDCPSGVCAITGEKEKQGYVVSTEEMVALVESGKAVILDARTGKYDDGERIPGAKQLAPDAAEELISSTLPDKNALIVAYCANKQCPAGQHLVDRLKKLGYSNLRKYVGGIAAWKSAGHTVKKPE